jgi:hypothetical protein
VSDAWPGAGVFSSSDGVSYTGVADIAESAVLGTCTTTLGAWSGGHVFDEVNSVTVNVAHGELSSTTHAGLLADRTVNAIMIGAEMVRFMTAELLSTGPNVYKLTRLLRGQAGTEWAQGSHAANEVCVLLRPQGLRRVATAVGDIGAARSLKGVTRGQALADVAAQAFTNTGVSSRPLSPVDLRAVRTPEAIVMSWKRRTRFGAAVTGVGGISAPLGEAVESYRVEIMDSGGSVVLRQYTVSSQTLTYPNADIEQDFGVAPPFLTVRVRQLGIGGIDGRALLSVVDAPQGFTVPGGGSPDTGDQPAVDSAYLWQGSGNVLLYRSLADPAERWAISSGGTLAAVDWTGTNPPVAAPQKSKVLPVVWSGNRYELTFRQDFIPGTWEPEYMLVWSLPLNFSTPWAADPDPDDYMPIHDAFARPARCIGHDGTTLYAVEMGGWTGRLWSASGLPPTWSYEGELTQSGTESSPPWPYWNLGAKPHALYRVTGAWLYVCSVGVWRTTQAVPLTGWQRITAVSNSNLTATGQTWNHAEWFADGDKIYLGGLDYASVSLNGGSTWTTTSLPAPQPSNPYIFPDSQLTQIFKLGTQIFAMGGRGTRVAVNNGSNTAWVVHAVNGVQQYQLGEFGTYGGVFDVVSDGTRAWLIERETYFPAGGGAGEVAAYRYRVRVSTDGINWISPEFA